MHCAVGTDAVPGLPDGGGAFCDSVQPAGALFLQEQPVGRICMPVIGQNTAQIRCGEEAGIQMTGVAENQFVELICSRLILIGLQQAEGDGTHIVAHAF